MRSKNITRRGFLEGGAALVAATGAGCLTRETRVASGSRWYKGMLHCHTYWSDAQAFPEQAVAAYRTLGYDFLSITDHNRLVMHADQCEWWVAEKLRYVENQLRRFPQTKTRTNAAGQLEITSIPYEELMRRANVPGEFLLIPGCEVTRAAGDGANRRQLHMNCVGLDEAIPSIGKALFPELSVSQLIRSTFDEHRAQVRAKGNPPNFFSVNHPQWIFYDVLPQDLIDNPDVRFFEVCNNGAERDAPPEFWRFGGYDNDRFWDVVNAFRARAGIPLLYGTAVDDAHHYPFTGATTPETCESGYAGDGYIRVRAEALTQAALFGAMDRGDFYAACGLDLEDVAFDGKTLRVRVPAYPGVTCRIRFIVTKRGFDDRVVRIVEIPKTKENPFDRRIPLHSDEIGRVAETVQGRRGEALAAAYTLAPDDLYVRARVESDRLSPFATWHRALSPHSIHPKFATAWTQPFVCAVMG